MIVGIFTKLTNFGKNDKTPPRPVIVSPYQNSGRKNGLGVCPISNAQCEIF